jgi:hypothetical protein
LLEHEDITAEIVARNISDTNTAVKEHFLGSPTVRLNGHDIDPGAGVQQAGAEGVRRFVLTAYRHAERLARRGTSF